MNRASMGFVILAFLAAVLLAIVWGTIVQAQYNLAGLQSIGVEISAGVRLRTTLGDIFSGFTPTFGGYIVLPSLLVAFVAAHWVAKRGRGSRMAWFGLAGGLAILLGIPLVNFLSPLAMLIGASRDVSCIVIMALGGAAAGLLFAWLTGSRTLVVEREPRVGAGVTAP